jgi:hypothetical protein
MREECVKCGLTANLDPSLHTERYGHVPEVIRDGRLHRFDFSTYTFQPTNWDVANEDDASPGHFSTYLFKPTKEE